MIILQRVGPTFAAAACAVGFFVVAGSPRSVYSVVPICLLAMWWVAASLPASGWWQRFERALVLALPLLAGGWLWLLTDNPDARQWLPIVTVGLVLLSGEVLFQVAYSRGGNLRLWMALITVILIWFGSIGLSLGNLLVAQSAAVAALLGSLYALALLHHTQWVYSLPRDPWWVQLTWVAIYWQVLWGILLLPIAYTVQAAVVVLIVALGLRLRLAQRLRVLDIKRPGIVVSVWVLVALLITLFGSLLI